MFQQVRTVIQTESFSPPQYFDEQHLAWEAHAEGKAATFQNETQQGV